MRSALNRRGAVLMEILLACFVLGMALVALSVLSDSGNRMALLGQLQTQAAIRCETVLNELILGSRSLSKSPTPFSDDPQWQWQAAIEKDSSSLPRLSVEVWRSGRLKNASRVQMLRLVPKTWSDRKKTSSFLRWP